MPLDSKQYAYYFQPTTQVQVRQPVPTRGGGRWDRYGIRSPDKIRVQSRTI